MSKIDPAIRDAVRRRAGGRCEYCRLPERLAELRFQIDHVVPRQHRGETNLDNLAFACGFCNRHKGPNLTGIDPDTNVVVSLYNPRLDEWDRHFRREDLLIIGITPVGRATVALLMMNARDQLQRRGLGG